MHVARPWVRADSLKERLGRPGHVFEQQVPLREQASEHQLQDRPLAEDRDLQLRDDRLGGLLDLFHGSLR